MHFKSIRYWNFFEFICLNVKNFNLSHKLSQKRIGKFFLILWSRSKQEARGKFHFLYIGSARTHVRAYTRARIYTLHTYKSCLRNFVKY